MTTTAVAYRPAFADTRVPGKPSPDSNDKAGWPEFQFTLKTYGRAASAEKKCRALRGAQQTYEDKEGEREKQPRVHSPPIVGVSMRGQRRRRAAADQPCPAAFSAFSHFSMRPRSCWT
ncbi:unnamed protein product [Prorocentrum cordatum]|uniref:Uncharacterized protein n=1 Tax=Prorocentrum cordatum TaxID=2364126 RepID=A0ABN9V2I2_9DINO|nr:unnamed protein product [Polarella glacialis]